MSDTGVLKVSAEKYKEFFQGEVWADLEDILGGRLQYAKALLETEIDHTNILRIQGAIEELRYLLDLQESIMEDYEFETAKDQPNLKLEVEND